MKERFSGITGADKSETDRGQPRDTHRTSNSGDSNDATDTKSALGTGDTTDTADTVRERKRKTLYLPEEFVDELELTFDAINLRWRQAGNDPLEKHPDFYEQLLRNALEDLNDVQDRDLEEIVDELGLRE